MHRCARNRVAIILYITVSVWGGVDSSTINAILIMVLLADGMREFLEPSDRWKHR